MTPEQAAAVIAAVSGLLVAVTGLVGAVTLLYVRVEQNRRAIDGRVNELIATSRVAGHAEGIALAQQLQQKHVDTTGGGEAEFDRNI